MTITDQWAGGFTANVTVSAGSSALSSWTVGFNLPSGAAITNSWSAVITTSGSSVTATNESYNGSLAAGQSTSFGFQGTDTGTISPATVSCA
jgi:cellulase/cellobiase CelA1